MTESQTPTEEEIADLLGQVQPHPGARFHHQMSQQPWNRKESGMRWNRFTPLKIASTLGLILLLVFGFSIFSPSLDALAQRFSQFFFPSASEKITPEIDPRQISHPLERFNLSIAEAESFAGYPLKTPTGLPPEYEFTGAAYDKVREAVILNYTTQAGKSVLRFSQQHLGADYQSIGPEAVVEIVEIGSFTGEYVTGGWKIPVPEVKSGLETNTVNTTAQAVWDAGVILQILRWADDEFLYEIIFAGSPEQPAYLDKEDLITLATLMQ